MSENEKKAWYEEPINWARIATVATLALATIIPWLGGYRQYDSAIAVNVAMTIAVIWTAYYAAENLKVFARAAEAELKGMLSVTPRLSFEPAEIKQELHLDVMNLGKGGVADLDIRLWVRSDDHLGWWRMELLDVPSGLAAGEAARIRPGIAWPRSPKDRAPYLLVRTSFSDALTASTFFTQFEYLAGEAQDGISGSVSPGHRVPDDTLAASMHTRKEEMEQQLRYTLDAYGRTSEKLEVAVNDETISYRLGKGVGHGREAGYSVYALAVDLAQSLASQPTPSSTPEPSSHETDDPSGT